MIERLKARDQSDAFASEFERDVTKACVTSVKGLKLGDIAAGLATLDTEGFPA